MNINTNESDDLNATFEELLAQIGERNLPVTRSIVQTLQQGVQPNGKVLIDSELLVVALIASINALEVRVAELEEQ